MSFNDESYSVSVVIAAYNAEKYIQRAIDSVLAQSRRAEEIIVVDDGSTDNTGEVVKRYGSKVRYIYQENAGPGSARNTAIEAAGGTWIAFLDADDEWLKDKLKLQIEHLQQKTDLVWTYSNYFIRSASGNDQKIAYGSAKYRGFLQDEGFFECYFDVHVSACIRPSTAVIKRRVIQQAGMFTAGQRWAEDIDLFFRIAYESPEIGFIAEPLAVYYCDMPDALTGIYKNETKQRCDLIERHLKLSAEHGFGEVFKRCAIDKLEDWARGILHNNRFADISEILNRFGYLLPRRLRIEMRLRKGLPRLAPPVFDGYFRLKRFLRPARQKIRPGTLVRFQALKRAVAAEISPDSTVLDIGSYDGVMSCHLKKLVPGLDITVVDIDEDGLKLARAKGLKALKASALQLPIPDNTVDAVLCLDLIEHIVDDSGIIREIARVLKSNGMLFLTTPMQNGVSFPFVGKERNDTLNKQWGHVRMGYSLEELERLLQDHNLKIDRKTTYFNFLTRFAYWVCYLSKSRIRGRKQFFRLVVRLEPYIKCGTSEHAIVGRKVGKHSGDRQVS